MSKNRARRACRAGTEIPRSCSHQFLSGALKMTRWPKQVPASGKSVELIFGFINKSVAMEGQHANHFITRPLLAVHSYLFGRVVIETEANWWLVESQFRIKSWIIMALISYLYRRGLIGYTAPFHTIIHLMLVQNPLAL